ncbi:class I SAM-dependent methyltransferase [Halorussus litoreus]|uniref:class I SAM-dependent methyltransferase n=1 Tax=Halorussus litoreus TaxID=1710536 RepID=UPI000E28484E|nr:class I SAM-dependent methyltransferase [Halorussus litoreus]
MSQDPAEWWNEAYEGDPPWDTGEPQSALVGLAEAGEIEGRVLDAGCGTGTEALYLAEQGHDVTGVDFSERAVEQARSKAHERGLDVNFRVGDALDLEHYLDAALGRFDTVVDVGLFHALEDDQRERYANGVADVLAVGGHAFVLSFAEGAPEDWGPNPVADADVREAFAGEEWRVRELREEPFETVRSVPGLLAVLERIEL